MIDLSYILIILLSALSIAVIVLFYQLQNVKKELLEVKEFNSKLFSRLTSLMQDMQSVSSAAVGIDQKVNQISEHVHHLDVRQDEIDVREQSEKPIQQAIALIERGASLDEIVENCGLSVAEAELLFRIHRGQD
ncbi:MAG: DUF2802 domain-containing protein [Gammaproteobacteria bacterium]|nr:DUF2802 domain-containing protein [Gammaproteobacteria bacterium]